MHLDVTCNTRALWGFSFFNGGSAENILLRQAHGSALWALQMKHTRFSRKKNASTATAAILDYLRPRDLGLSGMDEEFMPGSP